MTSPFLQRAETSLKSAKLLLGVGDTDGASSRAYYAMYDAVRACLGWAGIVPERGEFKTHHGITTAFGLHLRNRALMAPLPSSRGAGGVKPLAAKRGAVRRRA